MLRVKCIVCSALTSSQTACMCLDSSEASPGIHFLDRMEGELEKRQRSGERVQSMSRKNRVERLPKPVAGRRAGGRSLC